METTNGSLINLLKKGNPRAQKQLYEQLALPMLKVCMRYTGGLHDAEEAMNSGFYKAFTRIRTFEQGNMAQFVAWVRQIMINECLMHIRAATGKEYAHNPVDPPAEPVYTPDMPAEDCDCFRAVLSLPEGYRTIFNLYAIEGYTHSEIATMLGISESTSRSQLARGRDMLRNILSKK